MRLHNGDRFDRLVLLGVTGGVQDFPGSIRGFQTLWHLFIVFSCRGDCIGFQTALIQRLCTLPLCHQQHYKKIVLLESVALGGS